MATSLLGGLDGHVERDDCDEQQRREGAELMQTLAESGSVEGACGFAFCLSEGEVVPEDPERAEQYYMQAARAGCAQSMHQLGLMKYLGGASDEETHEAVRWFRMAAEHGISSSMYLLADCLLEGVGTPQDVAAALGWFAAAGELGHRGARSHIIRRASDDGAKRCARWPPLRTLLSPQVSQRAANPPLTGRHASHAGTRTSPVDAPRSGRTWCPRRQTLRSELRRFFKGPLDAP